jgi:hypothetical protein
MELVFGALIFGGLGVLFAYLGITALRAGKTLDISVPAERTRQPIMFWTFIGSTFAMSAAGFFGAIRIWCN